LTTGQGIWLLGGYYPELNDVWFSPDGVQWTQVVEHASWSSRMGQAGAVFREYVWIAGGVYFNTSINSTTQFNDCWYTDNGENWIQAVENAPWHVRFGHALVSFSNRLWIFGGTYLTGSGHYAHFVNLNDIWATSDGADWTRMPDAPWAPRRWHASAVFNGKLWILGGIAKSGIEEAKIVNDVWCMSPVTVSIQATGSTWREEGRPLDLKAVTDGISEPIRYQWIKDGSPLAGVTTDMLHIEAIAPSDEAAYTCQITDQYDASFTADPVLIRVFASGSLPVCGLGGCAIMTLGCLLAGWRLLIRRGALGS